MGLISTTDATFDSDVALHPAVLLHFTSLWCGACKAMEPHVATLAESLKGGLKVLKIDVRDSPKIADRFAIRAMPTLIFISKGEERGRLVGPSLTRLKISLEGWMDESGANHIPDPVVDFFGARATETTVIAAKVWCSFGGLDSVKTECIDRLRAAAKSDRITVSTDIVVPERKFEDVVGAPKSFGEMLDAIWNGMDVDSRRGEHKAAPALYNFIGQIPVGRDLSFVPAVVRYRLLYKSKWEITQYFADEKYKKYQSFIDQMKAFHDQELAGETISDATWENLQRAIVIAGTEAESDEVNVEIETLAQSLFNESLSATLYILTEHAEWLPSDAYVFTLEEKNQVFRLSDEKTKRVVAMFGEVPTNEEQLAEWGRRSYQARTDFEAENRRNYPDLYERFDAWIEHSNLVRFQISTAAMDEARRCWENN